MALQNIIDKILADAQTEADRIINAGQGEIVKMTEQKNKDIEAAIKAIEDKGKEKAVKLEERAGFQLRMIEKKAILKVKQDLINQVFQEVKKELSRLNKSDFQSLMIDILANSPKLNRGEVIARADRKNEIIRAFKKAGYSCKISKKELPPDQDGFILSSDEIEVNNTFSSLLDSQKEELESEVVKILFGSDDSKKVIKSKNT